MDELTIYQKLMAIQSELKVEKTKFNKFGEFDYRSCEDILKELKPFLKKHGLLLLLTDEVFALNDRTYVKAFAKLTDGKDEIVVSASAREPQEPKAKMDASQTTGSTSSYARKYALNGLLGLDDGNDSDKTNNGKDKTKSESGSDKLITKAQITELKSLGFDDARLLKMAQYHKVDSIDKVSSKQADEAIKKAKRANEKKDGGNHE